MIDNLPQAIIIGLVSSLIIAAGLRFARVGSKVAWGLLKRAWGLFCAPWRWLSRGKEAKKHSFYSDRKKAPHDRINELLLKKWEGEIKKEINRPLIGRITGGSGMTCKVESSADGKEWRAANPSVIFDAAEAKARGIVDEYVRQQHLNAPAPVVPHARALDIAAAEQRLEHDTDDYGEMIPTFGDGPILYRGLTYKTTADFLRAKEAHILSVGRNKILYPDDGL